MSTDLPILGWREYLDLPEWGVSGILAKIDTGARTSALHVADLVEQEDGRIAFDVVIRRRNPEKSFRVVTDYVRTTRVRSSTGHSQKRYVIETDIRIGDHVKRIEIGLTSRHNMICRMLVGRTALEHNFLVDSSRCHVQGSGVERKVDRRDS